MTTLIRTLHNIILHISIHNKYLFIFLIFSFTVGFNLSRNTLQSVVLRYGGKSGKISFNDFILVQTKVVVMFGEYFRYYILYFILDSI